MANNNEEKYIRELLDSSYQGVKRLFVLAYCNTEGNNQISIDSSKNYFLPRIKIETYNIEIDGRNVYDQPINDSIKQYDKIRKISTGQGDDYTTGCFLDFDYFEKNYRLMAADLSKQKALDTDSSAKYKSNNLSHSWTIKRNNTRIFQKNNKSVLTTYKWLNTVK